MPSLAGVVHPSRAILACARALRLVKDGPPDGSKVPKNAVDVTQNVIDLIAAAEALMARLEAQ